MKFSVLRLLIIVAIVAVFAAITQFAYENTDLTVSESPLEHLVKSAMIAVMACMMSGIVIVGIGGLSWWVEQAIRGFPSNDDDQECDSKPALPRPTASEG